MKLTTEKEKRNRKIYTEYDKLLNDGSPKMQIYKYLAKKYNMSEGGVRYAILCATLYR